MLKLVYLILPLIQNIWPRDFVSIFGILHKMITNDYKMITNEWLITKNFKTSKLKEKNKNTEKRCVVYERKAES